MDTQKDQTVVEQNNQKVEAKPAVSTSCRKHVKDDNATFFANLKDHMNEFVNASMDEHMTCFKTTMDKIFGTTLLAAEKKLDTKEVENHAPLQVQATVAE